MAIRKPRLSRVEQTEFRAAAQQLQARGLIPKIPERLEGSPALDIVVGRPASDVFELPRGGVGYAIWVCLVARQSGLTLVDCVITTGWDDQITLAPFDEASAVYKLGWLDWLPDEVLNQRIENTLRFHRRGDMVEGMILAQGLRPIPGVYRTDAIVPFQLTFVDSLGHEFGMEAELSVNRTTKRQNAAVQPRSSLNDPPETSESSEVVVREDVRVPGARINLSRAWIRGEEIEFE